MNRFEGEPPSILQEAAKIIEETKFGEGQLNPIEPFMRETFLPATLAFLHKTPGVLKSIITSRMSIGGVLGMGVGYFLGDGGTGFVVGVAAGWLFLHPKTISKARQFGRSIFRF